MIKCHLPIGLCLVAMSALADVRLPRLFSDNMILQQQTTNTVWGWADAGEQVTVQASWGTEVATTAGADGKWRLFLETPAHGTGHMLAVIGKNSIHIQNVAIGEVWLCAGQSNMGWAMGQSFEAEQEANVNLPNFRIFKSQREHWHEPLEEARDQLSKWKPCSPESAAETSAVSYWFGKKLHEELGIPVGIIVQAYAGTPIEGWMPWDVQKNDPQAQTHRQRYDENAKRMRSRGDTPETALSNFNKELDAYHEAIKAGELTRSDGRTITPPIITKPANLGHQYPGHIFNTMIYPIRPYGIKGMIWYQGERNSKDVPQAVAYRRQLALLIDYYRSSWHELSGGNTDPEFPFQFTQLPSWNPPQKKPVEGLEASWAVNRESMRLISEEVPNTGMVVAIDTGDAVALHPKNKKPLGLRHAYLALKHTYRERRIGNGPRYLRYTVKGDEILLEFDDIGSGLIPAKPDKLTGFAIAGTDCKWEWADAKIIGNLIAVSSSKVPEPRAVRYAWAMNPSKQNLLYNREGFPASPFRTDDWLLFDPNDEIVTVNKPEKAPDYESTNWDRPVMK